jgi:hypothetical protein
MRRARVVVIAVIMLFVLADRARADGALVLTPDKGRVGDLVRGEQQVSDCPTYRLRWKEPGGLLLGTDSASDGRGTVSFRVPDSPPGTQTVVATCQVTPGDEEQVVGGASLAVATAGPTSTSVTTIAPTSTSPPTTRPATSTTRSGPSSTAPTSTRPTVTTARPPSATTTTPTSTTSTTAGRRQDVAECERQAADAKSQLVYQPARRMTVGGAYEVVVSLALDASDVPTVVIPGPDRTTVVQLRTAECTIEAELIGGTDFSVDPPGPSGQSFVRTRVLTWRWNVSPNRTGPGLRLLLHLKPIIREDGRAPLPGILDVHEAVIEVDAQPLSLITKIDRHVNGFLDNPLAKFLIIPGGSGIFTVWAARRVRRRPSAKQGD